eukprot:GHVO01064979.1.p1 GENE.GHVO01064979.1~~GHVO01064979.1.p1  ORF type:complete len:102 (-),score=20.79 GHVO01064979.1:421-726(-)
MKRIKSDWRSSLKTPSLQRLMFLSIEGPPDNTINFDDIVLKWYNESKRSTQPGFTAWSPDHSDEDQPEDFNDVMDWLNTDDYASDDDGCMDIVLSDDDECL